MVSPAAALQGPSAAGVAAGTLTLGMIPNHDGE